MMETRPILMVPKGHDGNLFTQAFFKWFDDGLKEDLQELRVTGGESFVPSILEASR